MGTNNATLTAHFATTRTLTFVANPEGKGNLKLNGVMYAAPVSVGEGAALHIVAIAEPGYAFTGWTVSDGGGTFADASSATTTFTVGAANPTLTATFVEANQLTLVADPASGGSFKVNGVLYGEPVWVAPGASVTIKALPDSDYRFGSWTLVSGTGASISDTTTATTTFTMGTEDATVKCNFNAIAP